MTAKRRPIHTAPRDRPIFVGRDDTAAMAVARWDGENEWWRTSSLSCYRDPAWWMELPDGAAEGL